MEYTTNLNLKKPDVNEYYDIEKNNENMDLIDTAVGELNKNLKGIDISYDVLIDCKQNVSNIKRFGQLLICNIYYSSAEIGLNSWVDLIKINENIAISESYGVLILSSNGNNDIPLRARIQSNKIIQVYTGDYLLKNTATYIQIRGTLIFMCD